MSSFSKEDLSFVEELPKHLEIECPVCLNVLTDPHLVSCCGKNFCESCIDKVKASNGSCPMCKEEEYQVVINKERLRIINGLEVYCINREDGCPWEGELKNLSIHLNKEKREGECQYEEVKCRYQECQERKQRRFLEDHEDKECPQRPFECQYCEEEGTFLYITEEHYEDCEEYPVTCPNKCVSTTMPRHVLGFHVNKECPLQPVDCPFSWAGCDDRPLRKDKDVHTADTKHMTLLAVACRQLKKENQKRKKENDKIKEAMEEEITKLKEEVKNLKGETLNIHNAIADDSYLLLPIEIRKESGAVHFYTSACGRHMSARIMREDTIRPHVDYYIFLAFHEGKFDKFKPKLPKVIVKYSGKDTPLIEDTEDAYKQSAPDILNAIRRWNATLIQGGVIRIKLGTYSRMVTIFTICTK